MYKGKTLELKSTGAKFSFNQTRKNQNGMRMNIKLRKKMQNISNKQKPNNHEKFLNKQFKTTEYSQYKISKDKSRNSSWIHFKKDLFKVLSEQNKKTSHDPKNKNIKSSNCKSKRNFSLSKRYLLYF